MVWVSDALHPQPLQKQWWCQLPHQVHRHGIGLKDINILLLKTHTHTCKHRQTRTHSNRNFNDAGFVSSPFLFQAPTWRRSGLVPQRRAGPGRWCLEVSLASSVPLHSLVVVHIPVGRNAMMVALKLLSCWNISGLKHVLTGRGKIFPLTFIQRLFG